MGMYDGRLMELVLSCFKVRLACFGINDMDSDSTDW